MILVTLGTNDKSFHRLLEAIDQAIKKGEIQDKIIVQAGFTKFTSENMEVIDYIPRDQFETYIANADLVITHGGVGTIMTALKKHKKILAAARLEKYHEHVNDHQIQILESFEEKGYLIYLRDFNRIGEYILKTKVFEPVGYVSQRDSMVSLIESWITENE